MQFWQILFDIIITRSLKYSIYIVIYFLGKVHFLSICSLNIIVEKHNTINYKPNIIIISLFREHWYIFIFEFVNYLLIFYPFLNSKNFNLTSAYTFYIVLCIYKIIKSPLYLYSKLNLDNYF